MTDTKPTAESRFNRLNSRRAEVLRRAEAASALTLPPVFPKQPHTENSNLPTPYQGVGARVVNSLSSKLVVTLFPPNSAFFRLTLEDEMVDALKATGVNPEDVLQDLSRIESKIVSQLEAGSFRSLLSMAAKHLLIAGNGLLDVAKDGNRFLPLHRYVVNRDPMGNIEELIIEDEMATSQLPDAVREVIRLKPEQEKPDATVKLYTTVTRDGSKFVYHQEVNGVKVPGSEGKYTEDEPRFIVLRWTQVAGEDYGRGMVDEYIGDFIALDDLSRDLLKASAAAAKVVFVRSPTSLIQAKQFVKAKSGDMLTGRVDDIKALTLDKFADFRISLERLRDLEGKIERAFLVNTSIQRNGERVTAEEIRFMAQELEDSLGGVYSLLSNELQAPLVRRVMALLKRQGVIPNLPKGDTKLVITTGLEALGRGHELNKLMSYLRFMTDIVGQQAVHQRLDFDAVSKRASSGFGIDVEGMWKSEEKLMEEQNRALAAQITGDTVPGVVQQAMKPQ